MIAPGDLAVIIGLNVIGAAAPGPDVVLITRTATRSRRRVGSAPCATPRTAEPEGALTASPVPVYHARPDEFGRLAQR